MTVEKKSQISGMRKNPQTSSLKKIAYWQNFPTMFVWSAVWFSWEQTNFVSATSMLHQKTWFHKDPILFIISRSYSSSADLIHPILIHPILFIIRRSFSSVVVPLCLRQKWNKKILVLHVDWYSSCVSLVFLFDIDHMQICC